MSANFYEWWEKHGAYNDAFKHKQSKIVWDAAIESVEADELSHNKSQATICEYCKSFSSNILIGENLYMLYCHQCGRKL